MTETGPQKLTREEYQDIVIDRNRTAAPYPRDKTLNFLFEEQVEKTPENTAVVFKDKHITYRRLNEKANQMAHLIREVYQENWNEAVRGDTLIGVYMDRSIEMIIAILSVIKSGAAYVPFDSADPEERLKFKINDCACKMVLTSQNMAEGLLFLAESDTIPVSMDAYWEEIEKYSGTNPRPINKPEDLAYVIYTSGSTGRPKGVMIMHKSCINMIHTNKKHLALNSSSRVTQFFSVAFDASVWEIFPTLLSGSSLYIVPDEIRKNPAAMADFVEKENISVLTLPPVVLEALPAKALPSLKIILTGGDVCKTEVMNRLSENHGFVNAYGPTECTVCATLHFYSKGDLNTNIGKPLNNTTVYILDEEHRPVKPGDEGELYIGGDGLARGYLNRPELTKERFIQNPFATDEDKKNGRNLRIYKTGDMVKWLPNGDIQYIGRNDGQVKIRGFRIELGEIENKLYAHPSVETCAVVVREKNKEKYLCAFYTTMKRSGKTDLKQNVLRSYLGALLPDYMVPAVFVALQTMPVNTSGKIDRNALPEPDFTVDEKDYEAPANETEKALCAIWEELLSVPRIGATTDFFHMGGNSLTVVQLALKIHSKFETNISPEKLFETKTVREQAKLIGRADKSVSLKLGKAADLPDYPVLNAQKRMYLVNKIEGNSSAYNVTLIYRTEDDFDCEKLKEALTEIARGQESLRTRFFETEKGIRQKILDMNAFDLEIEEKVVETALLQTAFTDFGHPFDLAKAPLWRTGIFKESGGNAAYLVFVFHHIIFDGQSVEIFFKELSHAYHTKTVTPPPRRVRDYVFFERALSDSDTYRRQENYWRDELQGELPEISLPWDRKRPKVKDYQGGAVRLTIDANLKEQMRRVERRRDVTTFMLMFAAYNILLSRYSDHEDIITGIPSLGRKSPEVLSCLGMFVSTLPVRTQISGDMSVEVYLSIVKHKVLSAIANDLYPLEEMVSTLGIEREAGRNPLFDTVFALWNLGDDTLALGDASFRRINEEVITEKFDITGYVYEEAGRTDIVFSYAASLFNKTTIERFGRHYLNVLRSIVSYPEMLIRDIALIDREEYRKIICDYNRTARPYPKDKTLNLLFEEQVEKTPENTAVVFRDQRLTYRRLNEKANQLAHMIRQTYQENWNEAVKGDTLIGIYMDRSIEMIIAILGIIKSGAAYVPFDHADPEERLNFKINDCACKMVLTSQNMAEDLLFLAESDTIPVSMDAYWEEIEKNPGTNPRPINKPEDLAYVIYTSGSTGRPKGVMIEHRNCVNMISARQDIFKLDATTHTLQFASTSFDASVWEIFPAVVSGASLYIIPDEIRKNPAGVADFMEKEAISDTLLPPVIIESMPEKELPMLKILQTGGDACKTEIMDRRRRRGEFVNAYGPTESTVVATLHFYEQGDLNTNIGKPINNITVYILDPDRKPVPEGIAGELFIGGEGLARGYLNRPELTRERFIPNPFVSAEDKKNGRNLRLYKTGDVVRWLPNGDIQYLGRNDGQVKIRGYRIELGEIENKLSAYPMIETCAVIVRKKKNEKVIAAYYTVRKTEPKVEETDKPNADNTFIKSWESIYDDTYDDIAGAVRRDEFYGWNSSFTGRAIPLAEMHEWRDTTLKRILSLNPSDVFEIGCGTGLLMYPLLPHIDQYTGIDFSGKVIEKLKLGLKTTNADHAVLFKKRAHEIDQIPRTVKDQNGNGVVIINSVVQYFPNIEYLDEVLEKACERIGEGFLFIGDVRDYRLLGEFHLAVQVFKYKNGLMPGHTDLGKTSMRNMRTDKELLISPAFFIAFAKKKKSVRRVEILPKRGKSAHEMNRFRYDVILQVGPEKNDKAIELPWEEFKPGMTLEEKLSIGTDKIAIRNFPNKRVISECGIAGFLSEDTEKILSEYEKRNHLHADIPALEDLYEMAEKHGYGILVSLSLADKSGLDVVFFQDGLDAVKEAVYQMNAGEKGPRVYSNNPVQSDRKRKIASGVLNEYLAERLPAYMIPSFFVELDEMPLNISGKIDKKALPEPEFSGGDENYEAPSTDTQKKLCKIWEDLLGVLNPGINGNFFHLGGNSLKVVQLALKVNSEFGKLISPENLFQSKTVKEQADFIDGAAQSSSLKIERIRDMPDYPVLNAQRRMVLVNKIEGNTTAYNITLRYRTGDDFDAVRLKKALSAIAESQEALRTCFVETKDGIRQKILELSEFDLDIEEKEIPSEEIPSAPAGFCRPFDLHKAPLWRSAVYREKDGGVTYLLFDFHHSIFDGQSVEIFLKELSDVFDGIPARAPAARVRDYAFYEQEFSKTQDYLRQEKYWLGELSGQLPELMLPYDRKRTALSNHEGGSVKLEIDGRTRKALKELEKSEDMTPFMMMLAAFQILLSKYSREEDIIMGIPSLGRKSQDVMGCLGMFVSTLPIRTRVSAHMTVKEYFRTVKEKVVSALSNDAYPLEEMVKRLRMEREPGRNPLFGVMFGQWENGGEKLKLDHVVFDSIDEAITSQQFDLIGYVFEDPERMKFILGYAAALFNESTIKRLGRHYLKILDAISQNPEMLIKEIPLMDQEEFDKVVFEWNRTRTPYPRDKTLVQLFEEQVRRTPDKTAAVFSGKSLTFAALNREANKIAHAVRNGVTQNRHDGIKHDTIIGIYAERSPEMLTGIFGILKSGAAYLPLDPEEPEKSLRYKILDAGCGIILTSSSCRGKLGFLTDTPVKAVDLSGVAISSHSDLNPEHVNTPDDLAYLIYTSGSTGQPKGVMIEHRNVVAYAINNKYCPLNTDTKAVSFSSHSFDGSIFDIFSVLLNGGCTVFPEKDAFLDLSTLESIIDEHEVNTAFATTSFFNLCASTLSRNPLLKLRYVIFGGEKATRERVREFLASSMGAQLIHAYGPTETTVYATTCCLTDADICPIGSALNNTTLYVLDQTKNPVPIGMKGELYIGGDGVGRGYWNRPELTLERFMENPFASNEDRKTGRNRRIYKTGDIVRWLPDGNIDYMGRNDNQIKMRGFRIELEEIESRLLSHEAVKQAIVVCREHEGGKYLAAYYVLKSERAVKTNVDALRSYLLEHLPDYMVPAFLIEMAQFKLNSSNKIDKNALPKPDLAVRDAYQAPENHIQEKLCGVWKDVLGLSRVGVNDNFFDIGGDSIRAIEAAHLISKELEIDFRVSHIFNLKTVLRIAEACEKEANHDIMLLNQFKENAKNMVFIHPGDGGCEVYEPLSMKLDAYFNCYGIDHYNLYHEKKISHLNELALRYISYLVGAGISLSDLILAGWSMGGQIALEMAYILERDYNVRTDTVLMDTVLPDEKITSFRNQVNEDEYVKQMRERLRTIGYPDNYIDKVISAQEPEKEIAGSGISGKVNGNVLLFKAVLMDHSFDDFAAKEINAYIQKLADNNIGKVAKNLQVIKINRHHFNILEEREELAKNILSLMNRQTDSNSNEKAGILLLAGFLGSGKTTLLKRILSWETDLSNSVVLVNEFGDVGIDGALLRDSGSDVIELTSGCICCTLSNDLKRSLEDIWNRFRPRRIFIESSGVSDPSAVVSALRDPLLMRSMHLDKVLTVLDVDLWEAREVFGRLFYSQLEMADLILLNKIDTQEKEKTSQYLKEMHDIFPSTQIVPTIRCNIDPEALWTDGGSRKRFETKPTHIFSEILPNVEALPGVSGHDRNHGDDVRDFITFSFQDRRAMDASCFKRFVAELPWELFRLKGPVRLEDGTVLINFVGGRSDWKSWDGDPETRLAFIGWDVDASAILQKLRECLI